MSYAEAMVMTGRMGTDGSREDLQRAAWQEVEAREAVITMPFYVKLLNPRPWAKGRG